MLIDITSLLPSSYSYLSLYKNMIKIYIIIFNSLKALSSNMFYKYTDRLHYKSNFSICHDSKTSFPSSFTEATTWSQAWKATLHRFNGFVFIIHGSFNTATCRVTTWDIRSTLCRFSMNIMYNNWFNFFLFIVGIFSKFTILVFSNTFSKKFQQILLLWRWFRSYMMRKVFVDGRSPERVVHWSCSTRWGEIWIDIERFICWLEGEESWKTLNKKNYSTRTEISPGSN